MKAREKGMPHRILAFAGAAVTIFLLLCVAPLKPFQPVCVHEGLHGNGIRLLFEIGAQPWKPNDDPVPALEAGTPAFKAEVARLMDEAGLIHLYAFDTVLVPLVPIIPALKQGHPSYGYSWAGRFTLGGASLLMVTPRADGSFLVGPIERPFPRLYGGAIKSLQDYCQVMGDLIMERRPAAFR